MTTVSSQQKVGKTFPQNLGFLDFPCTAEMGTDPDSGYISRIPI